MTRSCEACRWWDRAKGNGSWGYCRVNPPSAVLNSDVEDGWPVTSPKDWCGAWSGKFFSGEPAEVLDGGVE